MLIKKKKKPSINYHSYKNYTIVCIVIVTMITITTIINYVNETISDKNDTELLNEERKKKPEYYII